MFQTCFPAEATKILIVAFQHTLAVVVQAYEGEPPTLLPFKFYDHFTMMPEDPIVSWIRSDLNPKIIHQLNDDGDDLKEQNEHYKGRTSMKTNALDSGDFSLTLEKPQISDSSNYTCTIWTGYEELRLIEIQLQVKDDQKVVVEAQKGAESVRLPCKTSPHLPEDTRVEWTLLDPVKMLVQVVRVYQKKCDDLRTHTSWAHTEMDRDLLTTGDLSLTIKYPTDRDRGTYICTFYVKGDTMKQRVELHPENVPSWIVALLTVISAVVIITGFVLFYLRAHIKSDVKRVEVESGVESVQLPCKSTTAYLMKDIRVEWTDSDNDIVYLYENGSKASSQEYQMYSSRTEMERNQVKTKDFSLTLKYPTDKDNYTYTCTIYSNDNKILLKKRVEMKVKVCQVEVEEGKEFVVLPFITTPESLDGVEVRWFYYKDNECKELLVYSRDSVEHHVDYRNRTEMNENPLGSGNLSLTLKDPKDTDSGKYRCFVKKNKDIITMKTVLLKVKVSSADRAQHKEERQRNQDLFTDPVPLMTTHEV
ncbi:uncharacterized protein LOC115439629 isoform X2 [Sphaeramia orbicularis]|uniref:uncharacterized protein LOC115439629 isoform X2 n=1 Tax=Sphaeramia orbicularis TaxID=375764 RepID=UPI00117EE059|nr:uncharacterized protein LOC115439629 isoform X2 [Sphaeramia orbicularis]